MLLFASVVGMSVTNGAIPWCPTLPSMLVMTFLCSMFEGSIETGMFTNLLVANQMDTCTCTCIYFFHSTNGQ